jgi:geranylgeranyl pyrophosphate synthase
MHQKFTDLYPRGKQARGALSVLGYQLAGGKNHKAMLKASVTLEIFETAVLIADDVFDGDATRRGVATIHKQWQDELSYPSSKQNKVFGEHLATITSMNGYYLAISNLTQTSLKSEYIQKALEFFTKSTILTGWGEAMDILPETKLNRKKDSYQAVHLYKTVWYSAILPLTFGALLAGKKDKKWLLHLEKYATALGRIFQIQDDILGSFGDPKASGKSNTSDLRLGVWTVLIELLRQQLSAKEQVKLDKLMKKPKRTKLEIAELKKLLKKHKIKEKAQDLAKKHLQSGSEQVSHLTNNSKQRKLLTDLLIFMLAREK